MWTMADEDRVRSEPERAILVGLESLRGTGRRSMRELMLLAQTSGVSPVGLLVQVRSAPDPATFLGRGKLEELEAEVVRLAADVVIFNASLTPTQQRNLVDALDCKVLDRPELILDIFGQHAHSREGKLQVELARLTYELPRLAGRGRMMSRIGGGRRGGVGVRGPGEPQLATERRHIERRLHRLRRELEEIKRRRDTERAERRRSGLPLVGLVGYTNAGKSTLLNALAGSQEVSVDDQLFETLDPTVRRVTMADGFQVLLSDTVGFIQDLPHSLVAAFRATLEEVRQADLLLHVLDASDQYVVHQRRAVEEVLEEIGADSLPTLLVLNKWDQAASLARARRLARAWPQAVLLSALTGEGLDDLRRRVTEALTPELIFTTARLPYDRMDLLALVRRRGRVVAEEYREDHIFVEADVDAETMARLAPYVTSE
ncbi:MAG: GTPase HflX [Armatimonadetes bacterium]|nr:GTPase HflX [Armatimonadota bacterium]